MLGPVQKPAVILCLILPVLLLGDVITLQQALEQSLKHNFKIRIARNQDQKIQNSKILGTGEMLPSLDAVAGIRETGGSAPDTWEAGLDANWIVFDGFRMFHNKKAYSERASLSSIQFKQKIEVLTVQVFQAYFNSVTQTFLLTTSQDQVVISSERLKKINFKKSLGTSSKSEQLNAQVALNEDRSLVQNRKLQKLIALNSLKLLLGLSVKDSIAVLEKFTLPKIKYQLAEWQAKAEKHNSQLSISQRSKRIEELNLSMAKSLYWPKIVVSGSVGYTGENNDPSGSAGATYSVGASLRLPLFAGFKNVTANKNSSLDNKNSSLALEEFQHQLESLLHQQWAVLQNAYQQVIFELDAVDLAKENLSISQQQLNLGNIEGVAFREAQLSLIKALTRLATSKFEARLALVELERLSGGIRLD